MLLFFHNPDRYTTPNLPIFWKRNKLYHPLAGVRADGYLGRPALTGVGGNGMVRFYPRSPAINAVANEFRAGGRFLFESYPSASMTILGAVYSSGQNYNIQLNLNPDGTMSFYRGIEEIKSGVTVLSLDTFYRIGFKGKVARVGGYCEVWLNATKIMRFDGNTAATDITQWGGIEWGLVEDSAVNHIYCGDSYGHQPDLIPSLLVKVLAPSSAGSFQQHVASGAASLTAAIDDSDPDGAATTITTDSTSVKTTSVMSTLGATAFIYAAMPTAVVRNAAAGGPDVRHIFAVGGTAYSGWGGGLYQSPSLVDEAFQELMWQRSDTGGGFDLAGINSMQWGVETGPA